MVSFPEIAVEKTVNQEIDNSDENMQREEESEVSNLRKYLHHYKTQNSHINHLND